MRNTIRNSMIAQYLLGRGGKNTITAGDLTNINSLIKNQFSFFQKFAEEIRNGELTGAKILQRVRMYGEAATNGYEQAKATSHGITLPEYPGDGQQICLSNCRCHWRLEDDGDFVDAYWVMNPFAEHCATCLSNSQKWNPLRVQKT